MYMSGGFGMFNILFVLFIGVFIFIVISNIARWQKNNNSPILTVAAQVVEKRKKRHHHNNGSHHHTSTSYHVTFRVKSGDTFELKMKRNEYHQIDENTLGQLTFQGTRYLSFEVS